MAKTIRKAVIPSAGFGTRFLPVTKASPKEMLPIVDKPVVQYVVEEAVQAGVEEIIFITSSNKRALEDHFDYNYELEERLKASGKTDQYEQIRQISDMARFVYVRQKEQKGTGHALMCARDLVEREEAFLVLWGDEFVDVEPGRSQQLVAAYEETRSPIVTAIRIKRPEDTHKYGMLDVESEAGLWRVKAVVEKPGPENSPSELASIGGSIITPDIFPILESLKPSRSGEIWLADALDEMSRQRPIYAKELFNASYYDSGNKFGFIKANIDFGLKHPETKAELLEYLRQLRDA